MTHNYERKHEYNIWFTLGVPPTSRLGLDRTVELLGEMAEVDAIRPLPACASSRSASTSTWSAAATRPPSASAPSRCAKRRRPRRSSERDIAAVRALQSDLRPLPEPFAGPAERHGFTVPELLEKATELQETGQMRRFAAVLYHRSAGFTANGMGVWKVPEERVDEMGAADGRLPRRLALLPAADVPRLAVQPVLDDARARPGGVRGGARRDRRARPASSERIVLYSTKEWKKTRLVYFSPDAEEWERRHAPELQPA